MNCPNCKRLIYSRQHRSCGYCGIDLPTELLLNEEEIAKLKSEQQRIEEDRLAAIAEEKQREAEAQQRATDYFVIMPFIWPGF